MAAPPIFKTFDPPTEKLLDMLSETLHYIAAQDFTLEQANAIKERLNLPLGVLGSKYHIPTNREARRRHFTHKTVDRGTE